MLLRQTRQTVQCAKGHLEQWLIRNPKVDKLTSECSNIIADPFNRQSLVEQTQVLIREPRSTRKSEDVYAVANFDA